MDMRTEAERQNRARKMLDIWPIHNVGQYIEPLIANALDGRSNRPFDSDEIRDALCPTLHDLTEDQINDLAAESGHDLDEAVSEFFDDGNLNWNDLDTDDKITVLDYLRVEPEQREVFEWYLVDDRLARHLEEAGEIILNGEIWGRQCTGQSVVLDRVIQDIAANLPDYLLD